MNERACLFETQTERRTFVAILQQTRTTRHCRFDPCGQQSRVGFVWRYRV
jgi:hypothetical protein